ncbi:AAA family ATPase [Nocardiopsis sp. NPDC049922]|uniref:helix-turn-helix transcriptional regulator n=1 Tax=Nocardiopsis sp. NPDC049922 TaxID=3155157 RepID=UPI0033F44784
MSAFGGDTVPAASDAGAPTGREVRAVLGIMDDMSNSAGTSPVVIGREEQLRLLAEHAERSWSESSGVVLVGGDAGVGKTRLVTEFARTRPAGTVFVGGCLQLGVDGLAYAPFTALLRQFLRAHGPGIVERSFPGGVGELSRLLPELGDPPQGRQEARGILFEQVLRLAQRVAGKRGATLVLEDLHWADGATRDLLVYLVRNLDLPGVQIIATYRSDDLHRTHPLRRLLPELERLPEVTRLDLAPLTREEVAEQVTAITGATLTSTRLDDLYERTDGIPLFVEALAASGVDRRLGPDAVPDHFRELLLAALHGLTETAVTVLRVASVGAVSGEIGHAALVHACDLPEAGVEEALHTLVDANLLRVHGTGYRFRHALLREAVHDEVLPGPCARLHLRFAQLIDEYPDAAPADRRAAEQAHHYQAGYDLPRALQAAWSAAEQAGQSLAHAEQLAMLERVLGLWDQVPDAVERADGNTRAEVLSTAGLSALAAGRPRRAWELCDEALAALTASDDDHTRTVRAVLLRCRGQARTQCVDLGAVEDLAEALRVHPPHMPGYGVMLSILARETMFRPREQLHLGASATDLARRALDVAERTGDRSAEAAALVTLGSVRMSQGDEREGRAIIERSILVSREIGDTAMEARGVNNLAHFLREQGKHGEGLQLLDGLLRNHRAWGRGGVHSSFMHQNRAEIHFELGRLDDTRSIVDAALHRSASPMHRVFLLVPWNRAAVAQGDLAAARSGSAHDDLAAARSGIARVDRAAVLSMERLDQAQQAVSAWLDLLLAEEDDGTALDYSAQVLDRLPLADSPGYGWVVLDLVAETVRRREVDGGSTGAHAVRTRLGEVLAGMPVHGPVQAANRANVRARLAEASGTPERVLEAWGEAVTGWERTPMVLHLARARWEAARAALAAGDASTARTWVGQAHVTAAECGADPLARAAVGLAHRLGAPLDGAATPPAAPAGLTARETEVLGLLASGSTNAEIARELSIAPKTASVHVSNILAKLGAANRTAAGARARELGLV